MIIYILYNGIYTFILYGCFAPVLVTCIRVSYNEEILIVVIFAPFVAIEEIVDQTLLLNQNVIARPT